MSIYLKINIADILTSVIIRTMNSFIEEIIWDENGLLPVVAQDANSGSILMVAWMSREALTLTVKEQRAVYWSRSRKKLWRKGEESGHIQHIKEIRLDCDGDVLVLKVEQSGGVACHTGRASCFYRVMSDGEWVTVDPVIKNPREIYT